VGIGAGTIAFLDVFLLHCLLADSPPDTPDEIAVLTRNQHRTAERGREPNLRLEHGHHEVTIGEWGAQLLEECAPIAEALDQVHGSSAHARALASAAFALSEPQRLPSARVLDAMRGRYGGSHVGFVKACSERIKQEVMQRPFSAELQARFDRAARQSVQEQLRIEASDTVSFEDFRQQYLSPHRLMV
jgi:glutamate--cysteine ligase